MKRYTVWVITVLALFAVLYSCSKPKYLEGEEFSRLFKNRGRSEYLTNIGDSLKVVAWLTDSVFSAGNHSAETDSTSFGTPKVKFYIKNVSTRDIQIAWGNLMLTPFSSRSPVQGLALKVGKGHEVIKDPYFIYKTLPKSIILLGLNAGDSLIYGGSIDILRLYENVDIIPGEYWALLSYRSSVFRLPHQGMSVFRGELWSDTLWFRVTD